MKKGKLNLVMGGQWGSEAKGKIAGYLALVDKPDFAVCNFMTNAGHWFRSKSLGDFLVQQLPISAVNPNIELFVSAGSAITLDVLFKEIEQFEKAGINIKNRLHIDRHAVIIEERHKQYEAESTKRIASTMKGCGYALADKVQRGANVKLAKDIEELAGFICDVSKEINARLDVGATGIGELAQGFDLSLNHGMTYPYVTSRDVTPMSFLSDCGITHHHLGDVYGVLRTYPIRVGNVVENGATTGYSGDCYDDQRELTWQQLSMLAKKDVMPELTTVTKRVRRIFTFSGLQMAKFHRICRPTHIALNFANYYPNVETITRRIAPDTHEELWGLIAFIHQIAPVSLIGVGADNEEIIDLRVVE